MISSDTAGLEPFDFWSTVGDKSYLICSIIGDVSPGLWSTVSDKSYQISSIIGDVSPGFWSVIGDKYHTISGLSLVTKDHAISRLSLVTKVVSFLVCRWCCAIIKAS